MARPYSRKNLARLVADGQDTASAAQTFNKSVEFIQKEQSTREYRNYLASQLRDHINSDRRRETANISRNIEDIPRPARASLIRTVDVRVNAALIDTTEFDQRFEYEVGKNPAGTEFRIRWYETSEAWQDGTPEASVGDAPITIEWLPATPVETEGEHRGVFRYKLNPNTTGEFDFLGDIDVI